MCIDQYFSEPASRRFIKMEGNKTLQNLFDYLQSMDQVESMIACTYLKRPAMECIIEEIEELFLDFDSYDLKNNMRHRQITGSMIRFIMGHYGYYPGPAKAMKKGLYIKTAIVYYEND